MTSLESFWETIAKKPETRDYVEQLKFGVQLGEILLNHEPLIKEVFRQQTNKKISRYFNLAVFSKKKWRSFFNKANIRVPAKIPRASIEEKKQTHVKAIAQSTKDSLPTTFFSSWLVNDNNDDIFGNLPRKKDVV